MFQIHGQSYFFPHNVLLVFQCIAFCFCMNVSGKKTFVIAFYSPNNIFFCSFTHVYQCLHGTHFLSNAYLNQEVLYCALASQLWLAQRSESVWQQSLPQLHLCYYESRHRLRVLSTCRVTSRLASCSVAGRRGVKIVS